MGKPTGFLEYERKNNQAVEPLERIKNFNEFHTPMREKDRREQAARCMNCGVPFCQSGRTGTDDCNLFAGPSLWRLRPHQVVGITVLDDRILICLAGNRCIIQTTGACCLTECRADSGGKLRKVIGLTQHLQCLFIITMI